MKIFWFIFAGLLGGVFAGMGMGGGTMLIPILTIFLKLEQHTAQAINLISFIPMAVVCLIIHFKNGLLKIKEGVRIALLAMLGAAGGAFLSMKIKALWLSKVFGGFLIALALFQFVMFVVKIKKQKKQD